MIRPADGIARGFRQHVNTWQGRALTLTLFLACYLAWSGFKPSLTLFTGDLATYSHTIAGFSIDYPPLWTVYASGLSGRKGSDYQRLLMYQRLVLGTAPTISVQHRPTPTPDFVNARTWIIEEGLPFSDLLADSPAIEPEPLNGRPGRIHQIQQHDRLTILAIVLGRYNEYYLTFTTKHPERDRPLLNQILGTFRVKNGN